MTEEDRSALTNGESTVKIVKKVAQDDGENETTPKEIDIAIKVYRRRWFMLCLYIFYTALVAAQWIQYSIIANIIQRYYDVSSFAVDCTSMIFMFYYGIFIFPVSYLSDRIGLRWTIIAGSALCCVGSWIKILSVDPDKFYVALIGQSVIAVSLVFVLPLPGRVAAEWFAADELSTATSLGIFGPQLGVSVSFLLPPVVVKNHENVADIGTDLAFMFWFVAVAATLNLALVLLFFQDQPKLPPNKTVALQKMKKGEKAEPFVKPMKRLMTNQSFLILCNSYGLNVGILNALGTLLNQLYLIHFENGEEDAGRIGLLIILTGMFGSITFGIILDKTHKFKETTVIVYFLTLCGQILFAIAIFLEVKWMVYASSVFLGFFMSGYLMLGYELAAEYTYPESEFYSAGILNITNNVYGIILVLILEVMLEHYGDVPVHVIFCVALLVGLIMTIMTKDEQRRQEAQKAGNKSLYQNVPVDEKNIKDIGV
ncbi:feline leukemia virus subgroup C receptor-related protein 2 [Nasonia vitripennis]|uniref:Major facilitator superfamily (MFS) profile domain-containing protein n=1 Tax=Nasonia vitripennis TaxID=7425 RepID=A0A7M7G895_NASVI|nr:feline leukemia virus subgroup C receptor-related protein 2 [Nasonia vitripennis]